MNPSPTPRQQQILELVLMGKRYREVSEVLKIPEGTVKAAMHGLQKLWRVDNLVQLGHCAARAGMVLLLAFVARAQTPVTSSTPPIPGNTVQTSVITSYAPAGASVPGQIVCTVGNPPANRLTTSGSCNLGGTVAFAFSLPVLPVGVGNGASYSIVSAGNSITYLIQQLTAGVISWQVVANGVMASGTL
jgi:DNA-binding CsgD family transcriptional regulator